MAIGHRLQNAWILKFTPEKRQVSQFMDFVLVREDYKLTKPHPEPYLTGLKRPSEPPKKRLWR